MLTALSGGNVGIGTTNPVATLDVAGAVNATSLANAGSLLNVGSTTYGSGVRILTADDSPLVVQPGNQATASGATSAFQITSFQFKPTTGNGQWSALTLDFEVNQTGGANGVTRGIYVKPTLTAAADFRAIETTAGNVIVQGGNVGVGTAAPSARLDVASGGAAAYDTLLKLDNPAPDAWSGTQMDLRTAGATRATIVAQRSNLGSGGYLNLFTTDSGGTLRQRVGISDTGMVSIGTAGPAGLDVLGGTTLRRDSGTPVVVNRTTNDGTLIDLQQDGTSEGSITVAGGTISFNPFTGSHYGWTQDEGLQTGMLLTMTGANQTLHADGSGEVIYGVSRSQRYNDPAVLGAYLAPQGSANDRGTPIVLVMAVGNGEMWVVDSGAPLAIGDYLIASDVPGHAMKDDARAAISHVVGRVAEPIDWSRAEVMADGRRHAKVSVLFDSFSKDNATRAELDAVKSYLCEKDPDAPFCVRR